MLKTFLPSLELTWHRIHRSGFPFPALCPSPDLLGSRVMPGKGGGRGKREKADAVWIPSTHDAFVSPPNPSRAKNPGGGSGWSE